MSLVIATWLTTAVAVAAPDQRIEGRYFPNPHLELQSRWAIPVPHGRMDPELVNRIVAESAFIELRLMIPTTLVGKHVRVFMSVPAYTQGMGGHRGFEVDWTTQGTLLPGRARPGERVLLFDGVASDPVLRDFIAYRFQLDARYMEGPLRFEPVYEIERR